MKINYLLFLVVVSILLFSFSYQHVHADEAPVTSMALKGENIDEEYILLIYGTTDYIHLILSRMSSPTEIVASTHVLSTQSSETWASSGEIRYQSGPENFIESVFPDLINELDRSVSAVNPLKVRYVSAFFKGYDQFSQVMLCQSTTGYLKQVEDINNEAETMESSLQYGSCQTHADGQLIYSISRGDLLTNKLKEVLGKNFVQFAFEPLLADENELMTLAARVNTEDWSFQKDMNVIFSGQGAFGLQIRDEKVIKTIAPEIDETNGGFYQLGKMACIYFQDYMANMKADNVFMGLNQFSFDDDFLSNVNQHAYWHRQRINLHPFAVWCPKAFFTSVGMVSVEAQVYHSKDPTSFVPNMLLYTDDSVSETISDIYEKLTSESDEFLSEDAFVPLTRIMGTFPWHRFFLKRTLDVLPDQNLEIVTPKKFEAMLNYAGYYYSLTTAAQNKAVRVQQPEKSFFDSLGLWNW